MLPHPARRSTGAAGIDQAREVCATGSDPRPCRRDVGRVTADERVPVDDARARSLGDAQRLERDHQSARIGGDDRR